LLWPVWWPPQALAFFSLVVLVELVLLEQLARQALEPPVLALPLGLLD
jgi:hypothetical protein